MTIVGQCLGADRKDEAVYYIKKLCVIAEIVMAASCVIVFALTKPITILVVWTVAQDVFPYGRDYNCKTACMDYVVYPGIWHESSRRCKIFHDYILLYNVGMQNFCLCFLIRVMGFGAMGVWIGMFADWTVRSIIFTWRFHSRKWLEHKVI